MFDTFPPLVQEEKIWGKSAVFNGRGNAFPVTHQKVSRALKETRADPLGQLPGLTFLHLTLDS